MTDPAPTNSRGSAEFTGQAVLPEACCLAVNVAQAGALPRPPARSANTPGQNHGARKARGSLQKKGHQATPLCRSQPTSQATSHPPCGLLGSWRYSISGLAWGIRDRKTRKQWQAPRSFPESCLGPAVPPQKPQVLAQHSAGSAQVPPGCAARPPFAGWKLRVTTTRWLRHIKDLRETVTPWSCDWLGQAPGVWVCAILPGSPVLTPNRQRPWACTGFKCHV